MFIIRYTKQCETTKRQGKKNLSIKVIVWGDRLGLGNQLAINWADIMSISPKTRWAKGGWKILGITMDIEEPEGPQTIPLNSIISKGLQKSL